MKQRKFQKLLKNETTFFALAACMLLSLLCMPVAAANETGPAIAIEMNSLFGNYDTQNHCSHWTPNPQDKKLFTATESYNNYLPTCRVSVVKQFKDAPKECLWLLRLDPGKDSPNYDCHACARIFGVVWFKKYDLGWKRVFFQPVVAEIGNTGSLPALDCFNFVTIGKNRKGLSVQSGFTAQGETTTAYLLYAIVASGKMEPVLNVEYEGECEVDALDEEDITSIYSFSSSIDYDDANPSRDWYDIIHCVRGSRLDSQNKAVLANERTCYTFNGAKYVVKTTQKLAKQSLPAKLTHGYKKLNDLHKKLKSLITLD